MKFKVWCVVYPTEDYSLVKTTLESLLGPLQVQEKKEEATRCLVAEFDDREVLRIVRQMIHDRRIIDAVRARLRSNWNGFDSSFIRFDKQAATLRKLRLIDDRHERPSLGSIQFEFITGDEAEFNAFLNWFVPPTEDGKVIRPR